MNLGAQTYQDAFISGLLPDPNLSVAEWSNRYRILSQKGSAEPGPYRIERTPYLREILDCLSPHSPVQRVVFMKSAQVGASEAGFNWIGFIMHACPGPTMMVQPTTELAEKVSKQRIASMIEETPVLREIVEPEKTRSSGNSILLKNFRGGVLSIVGANSPVGLRSMPVRFLFCDEVDAYPRDVGTVESREGDPVSLAIKRTQTFGRRKIFLVSTPTVKDASRIEIEYNESDQRRYHVPCPHCGVMQWLQWKQIKWTDDDPLTTAYQCEHCKELIGERYKTAMLEAGEWVATAPGPGKSAGFHISALYSPVGWTSWVGIVDEFLKARRDAPQLKTWVNTILGESWEDDLTTKIGAEGLQARVELRDSKVAPAGVMLITAGVDLQDNRIEISLYGWGVGEEAWVLSHTQIFGDPARPELWKQVEDFLLQPIPHETCEPLKVTAACFDSGGHHTQEAYDFCRMRRSRNWLAIKGQSQKGKPSIGKPSRVDVNIRGQVLKGGAEVFPVGVDTIKDVIFGRLKHNEPGPGYTHYHQDLPTEFFEQLTAEKKVTRYVRGQPIREYVKKNGARNEALDCAVYSYAALRFVLNAFNPKTVWQQFEKRLKPREPQPPKVVESENRDETGQNKTKQSTMKPNRRNFVNTW